jgi:hypothetical protein
LSSPDSSLGAARRWRIVWVWGNVLDLSFRLQDRVLDLLPADDHLVRSFKVCVSHGGCEMKAPVAGSAERDQVPVQFLADSHISPVVQVDPSLVLPTSDTSSGVLLEEPNPPLLLPLRRQVFEIGFES